MTNNYQRPRTYRNYANKRITYRPPQKRSKFNVVLAVLILAVVISIPVLAFIHTKDAKAKNNLPVKSNAVVAKKQPSTPAVKTTTTTSPAPNVCANNNFPKLMLTSIGARHLWACSGTTMVYQTAVVTGDTNLIEDATPIGTYHIYSKQTNTTLTGSDARGSWNDYVYYWMPFLSNQYGVFGLHDATWRSPTDFGNIDPSSNTASHGCIELPISAAQWLFDWSNIGTTVTIES